MNVKKIERELQKDPAKLTKMFLETFEVLRGIGGADPPTCALRAAIMIAMSLTGEEKLTSLELDKYSRMITAVVDAMLFCKN